MLESDRQELISWLITPTSCFSTAEAALSIRAKELLIILVDFMLHAQPVARARLQLLGITSLLVVCRVS